MNGRLRPQPDEIQRELRLVLRVGLRPARVERDLERLPAIVQLTAADIDPQLRYDVAIRICEAVEQAITEFGDGPFGTALRELFGLRAGTRGTKLDNRRLAAAVTLNLQVGTIARHWEKEALFDLAVKLYHSGRGV